MNLVARVLVCVAALALSSCERGLNVEITGAPDAPDFFLSAKGLFRAAEPAVGYLNVAEVSAGRYHPIWGINRGPACTPTPRFHFGTVPAGWRESTGPQRLKEGVTYVLSVSGCGFSGGRVFKILGGHIVSREGTGDDPIKAVQALNWTTSDPTSDLGSRAPVRPPPASGLRRWPLGVVSSLNIAEADENRGPARQSARAI